MAVREVSNPMPGMQFYKAGAPTNNVTYLGVAPVGATLQDTTNGVLYMCTVSTASTITWVSQT
jgi:hypothetical protein